VQNPESSSQHHDATTPAIQLSDIRKKYGGSEVLKGASLTLAKGHFYALVGPNGAGKSTLMRVLARHEAPNSGAGTILGLSILMDNGDLNARIGYVSETFSPALPIPIKGFFANYRRFYPRWNQELFDEAIAYLGVSPDSSFSRLSRGQKMQIDEITSVLDAKARSYFMNIFSNFVKEGGTVLMATNIVSEIHHHADHLVLLENGKVRLNEPIPTLARRFRKLRKPKDVENEIFHDSDCVYVGINSDNSTSFVVTLETFTRFELPETVLDSAEVTAEEAFIYFTTRR
jgi:ABC-2 type transport system ATP-binding protein